MGSPKETGRGERRAPHLRDVLEEQRTVGEELQLARLRRGEDLRDAATKLRIRPEQLEALEEGRFEDLPGKTYVVGFLRSYARHLGLDPDAVLNQYRLERRPDASGSALYFPEPIKEARRPRTWIVALGLVFLGVLYAAWYYGSAERRLAQNVSPLPDRLGGQSVVLGTEPRLEQEGATSTVTSMGPAPTNGAQPAAPAPRAQMPLQEGPVAAEPQGPPAPPQIAAAPLTPGQAPLESVGPSAQPGPVPGAQEGARIVREGGPPREGAPLYSSSRGDTAIAAVGPRDWRSAPASDYPPANQNGTGLGGPQPGTGFYGPQTPPAGDPATGMNNAGEPAYRQASPNAPGFGNLIAAARNEGQAGSGPGQPSAPPTPGAQTQIASSLAAGVRETFAAQPPVTLHANGATWVQVEGQDGILLSRILEAGESYRLPDQSGLVMTIGNAGGLDIEVNGTHTGPIGPVGAVRRNVSVDQLRSEAR